MFAFLKAIEKLYSISMIISLASMNIYARKIRKESHKWLIEWSIPLSKENRQP